MGYIAAAIFIVVLLIVILLMPLLSAQPSPVTIPPAQDVTHRKEHTK